MSNRELGFCARASKRVACADLVFAAGGGRTVLVRQSVPYPFHVTRAFQLDEDRPDVATLYLQSSSGGVYRGDDLTLCLGVRSGASAHITTQSATMVHDTGASPARQRTTIDVATDGFVAYTPDPLVLFPGASLSAATSIQLAAGACAIIVDGFTWHDPTECGRPFDVLVQELNVRNERGDVLVHERGTLRGEVFLDARSPLGPFRAAGTMHLLSAPKRLPEIKDLQQACDAVGCLSGATNLPNGAGRMIRCLARDGGDLRRALDRLFSVAFAALIGIKPAPRRK